MAEPKTGPRWGIVAAIVGAVTVATGAVVGAVFWLRGRDGLRPPEKTPAEEAVKEAAEEAIKDAAEEAAKEAAKDAASKGTSSEIPNLGGDPAGYDTKRYPSPYPVRLDLVSLGYLGGDALIVPGVGEQAAPGPAVEAFSRDYNRISAAVTSGKLAHPQTFVSLPIGKIGGKLSVPGKQFLKALKIAALNQQNHGWAWKDLAEKAKAAVA